MSCIHTRFEKSIASTVIRTDRHDHIVPAKSIRKIEVKP